MDEGKVYLLWIIYNKNPMLKYPYYTPFCQDLAFFGTPVAVTLAAWGMLAAYHWKALKTSFPTSPLSSSYDDCRRIFGLRKGPG